MNRRTKVFQFGINTVSMSRRWYFDYCFIQQSTFGKQGEWGDVSPNEMCFQIFRCQQSNMDEPSQGWLQGSQSLWAENINSSANLQDVARLEFIQQQCGGYCLKWYFNLLIWKHSTAIRCSTVSACEYPMSRLWSATLIISALSSLCTTEPSYFIQNSCIWTRRAASMLFYKLILKLFNVAWAVCRWARQELDL